MKVTSNLKFVFYALKYSKNILLKNKKSKIHVVIKKCKKITIIEVKNIIFYRKILFSTT